MSWISAWLRRRLHTDEDKLCGRDLGGKPRKALVQSLVTGYLEQIGHHAFHSRFKTLRRSFQLAKPSFQLDR